MFENGFGIVAIQWCQNDADTAAAKDLVFPKFRRQGDGLQYSGCHLCGIVRVLEVGHQHDEFVTPQTGHGIALAQAACNPFCSHQ